MILLKNIRFLVTQNPEREIFENVDVLIERDRIKEIGRNLGDTYSPEKVIDCSRKVVLPGLINTHTHVAMTGLRGISDNQELQEWLQEEIFPAEEKLKEEEAYFGSLLGSIEMLESGTTCFNDMYFHMEEVAKAVEDTGMRAVLGRGTTDLEEEVDLDELVEELGTLSNYRNVVPSISPHAIYACSEDLLLDSKQIAEKFKILYHIHVSETEKENRDCLEERNMTPVEYFDNLGILDENTLIAHGTHLSEEDRQILAESGAKVAHNPSANLKLGSGIAEVPEMRHKGIEVGLGTDGPASNNDLNLFREMKTAALLHKRKSPEDISEQEILDMATIEAAKTLGLDHMIASIEKSKKADLISIDLDQPSMRPFHGKEGVLSNLVYSFHGNVSEVIVNGELRVENGELVDIDRDYVFSRVQKLSQKFGE